MNIKKTSAALMAAAVLMTFSGCNQEHKSNIRKESNSSKNNEDEVKASETNSLVEELLESLKNPDTEYWENVDYSDASSFKVESNDSGVTITGLKNYTEEIKIPLTIEGKSVTKIGSQAFANSYVTSVYIPESVTKIEPGAFDTCTYLSKIYLSEGVTEIGHHAFNKCKNLTYVFLPDSMKKVGDSAFSLCYNLSNVSMPKDCTTGIATFDELHKNNGISVEKRLTPLEIALIAMS